MLLHFLLPFWVTKTGNSYTNFGNYRQHKSLSLHILFFSLFMSMEWLLRFATWKSSVKGVLARRSEPLTATRKVRFRKEVKGVIFALNLLETWRGSVGLPVAVYLAPDPPGGGFLSSLEPLSRRLSAMSSRYALKAAATRWASLSLDRAGCRGFVRLRKVAPGDERIGVCATALYGGVSWV